MRTQSQDPSRFGVLVTVAACAASVTLFATAKGLVSAAAERPGTLLLLLGVTLALQLLASDAYSGGLVSVAGVGMIAAGLIFGPGAAVAAALVAAGVHALLVRPRPWEGVFNAAVVSLGAAGAGGLYYAAGAPDAPRLEQLGVAAGASVVFLLVTMGLMSVAVSVAEGGSLVDARRAIGVWNERFRWLAPHYLAFGPLALAATIAYEEVGVAGVLVFTVPAALMTVSVRLYIQRTRDHVQRLYAATEDLGRAKAELAVQNEDLNELFQFAVGLAARSHNLAALVEYAEEALARLTGARVRLTIGGGAAGIGLVAAGRRVAGLEIEGGTAVDPGRWDRLREALLPHLAAALKSAELSDEVKKRHVATIAALSRSMEAKDYYTGGHTERVSDLAVAIAKRLGYSGDDLEAIEIGALLHDIGKIGIPERILHKPGPLDDEEWKVMKEHPIISEYILTGVKMSPIVLQIARSSHERIDGKGYPDGLAGDHVPLPARIVLAADAFDALTSDRPYRRARSVPTALEEIRANAGTQFCPRVVEALDRVYREEPHILGAGQLRAVEVEAGAA